MNHSTRLLSTALAVVLASSLFGIPAFAAEADDAGAPTEPRTEPMDEPAAVVPAVEDSSESPETPEAPEAPAPLADVDDAAMRQDAAAPAAAGAGAVRVTLTEGRPDAVGSSYDVSLAGPDGFAARDALSLSAEHATGTVRFDGLADGTYVLTVSTPGVAAYAQQLDVHGDASTLELVTGDAAVDTSLAHPGVLVSGDATADGVVNDDDAQAVIDALELGLSGSDAPACDIDGDGTISLADLQTAVANFGATQVDATVARTVSAAAVKATVEGGTVEGDLAALVGGGSAVTLEAADTISDAKPVEVGFDLAASSAEAPVIGGLTIQSPQGDNAIAAGAVTVELVDGDPLVIPLGTSDAAPASFFRAASTSPTAVVDADGTIVIDLQGQVAVKKVTLRITKTAGNTSLAEISQVEFLGDMASRIPEPEMNVPQNLAATPGSKTFDVSWDAARNVTGYELSISANGVEEITRTTATKLTVSSFKGKKIENGTVFTVKVQSTNGAWRSGWSDPVEACPKADKVPDAPEGVTVKGLYRGLAVSWKNMKDTDSYNLFYRAKGDEGAAYTKVEGISATSYEVSGLQDDTDYQVYLTGVNELGEGGPSLVAVGRTVNVKPAQLPGYQLVNTKNADGAYLDHIVAASYGRGSMTDSPLDAASGIAKSALGLFDGSYGSYLQVNDWDEGGAYPGSGKGVTVEFDEPQTLGMITFAEVQNGAAFGHSNVTYRDESGAWKTVASSVQMRTGENGRAYALVKLAAPITASTVKLGVGRAYWAPTVVIAEMRFHAYDSIEDDIMALYADDLHLELRDTVDAAIVDALQRRLDTPDAASGEYHPLRAALQRELDNARGLLEATGLDDTVRVHNGISAARDDRNLGIGGLNAWQPLGAVAGAGDQIVVYVGAPGKTTGSSAPLRLVVSQQHPESSAVAKVAASLKVGRNEITIPSLTSSDVEHGGQLYVEYTGSNDADAWGVRVSGAQAVPSLDLYQVTDPAERLARTTAYVEALESFVPELNASHEALHAQGDNRALAYAYDERNCIGNATDVMLDQMLYSAPAQQLLAAAGSGSTAERATKLLAALDGMDQMMELFYQHKGLTSTFDEGTDAAVVKANTLPSRHLNIRYTRMFAGAFMYAAGNHIGIEWGSVPGLGNATPVVVDESGARVSGGYFGWGIAHEIGHNINQSQYAYAEVTNNYFAQLTRTDETSASARFSYDDVYDRVTSGEMGRTRSVFVQLAMYWQLRLAYDAGGAYELYGTYQEAFANRFFARVDSYARAPQTAPAPGGTALTLGGGESQTVMRLASAAAERDLTDFFARWGMVPDETTAAYLKQFSPETRALCYANDDARAYARTHADTGAVAGKDVVHASAAAQGSQVTLTLRADVSTGDSVLGYEVTRVTVADGQPQREVVGFSTSGTYVDNASALGNRTVSYDVVAVDKFLNRSAVRTVSPLKLDGDGMQDKDGWTVSTNMVSPQDTVPDATEDDPDAPAPQSAAARIVDGDAATVFTGTADAGDPYITVDLGTPTEVTAVRYALADASEGAAFGAYRIETSLDGATFTPIKEGELALSDGAATLYFDNGKDPWICTYDARYLRITAPGQAGRSLSIGEIDVFGPSGDDVSLLADGVGLLKSDFTFQQGEGQDRQFVPQGSLVFTGAYKGNPAYNVVVLYDAEGNVVGGVDDDGAIVARQVIFAPDPGDAMLGETSEGTWLYWIEPAELAKMELPSSVRAELYRVDNALTNEGQRLVSDSLLISMPDALPEIELHR